MEVSVRWCGEPGDPKRSSMRFTATTASGHEVSMDGAPSAPGEPAGGRNEAARPMELLLAATGGCTAYDVVLILRRQRQQIEDCEVKLVAERAASDPKVFTRIHFHFTVTGHAVAASMVERAIKLSHEKYCSASIMLAKTAELSTSFEIRETPAD